MVSRMAVIHAEVIHDAENTAVVVIHEAVIQEAEMQDAVALVLIARLVARDSEPADACSATNWQSALKMAYDHATSLVPLQTNQE